MLILGLAFVSLQSPAAPTKEPPLLEGVVTDAFTGLPVEGAELELFAEDEFAEPERVAVARTGPDGRYSLVDAARRGEKLRARHPRYRSTLDGSPERDFVLFPRDEPCELTLLDLDGLPIAGATVVLRQTCHHAVPTTSAESDAAGRVTLADLPPLYDNGELSVLAPGYSVLENLEPSDVVPSATLYLPRRRAVRLRLLDESGAPAVPGRCSYSVGQSSYPIVPDALGRVTLTALFERDDGGPKLAGSYTHELPPAGEEFSLRFGNWRAGADSAELRVSLDAGDGDAKSVRLAAFHRDGHVAGTLGQSARLPPGAWRVVVGAPFSGWRESIHALDLAPREQRTLELAAEREPALRVLLPEGGYEVHVQAGDDSISRFVKSGQPFSTGVPPGVDVVVLAQGRDVRRARHAPWSGELELDLRDAAALVEPQAVDEPPFELVLRARTSEGRPLAVKAGVRTRGERPADEDPADDVVRLRFPAGVRYEVALAAEGHVTLFRAGLATAGGSRAEDVMLPRE